MWIAGAYRPESTAINVGGSLLAMLFQATHLLRMHRPHRQQAASHKDRVIFGLPETAQDNCWAPQRPSRSHPQSPGTGTGKGGRDLLAHASPADQQPSAAEV